MSRPIYQGWVVGQWPSRIVPGSSEVRGFTLLTFPLKHIQLCFLPQDLFLPLYPICDNSLSYVIGWASFSLVDERINLLPPHSFMEMECPWLEFAAHLLSFTQGYLLKTMPSPHFHLSACLTGPEAGFL